jgi:tripartite-type tricarboxylate transporter receptor subunit TctC
MIKRLLLVSLMMFSATAMSAEKITLYWGFSPASNTANIYRTLVRELNKIQNKYDFVFETRPGGGGAVAANHILQNPNNTLLGGTSSFFVRSNFDKSTGYNTNSFKPIFVQSQGSPLALWSSRHKSLQDIKKTDEFTVSISGFGSHSNLMADILKETYPGVRIINYTGLTNANKDVLGKHIDFGWNWLSEVLPQSEARFGYIVGITGTRNIGPYKTFTSQGIKGFENTSTNTAIYASQNMPDDKVKEIHEFLQIANKSPEIILLYNKEHSVPAELNVSETRKWYADQAQFWAEQSAKLTTPFANIKNSKE